VLCVVWLQRAQPYSELTRYPNDLKSVLVAQTHLFALHAPSQGAKHLFETLRSARWARPPPAQTRGARSQLGATKASSTQIIEGPRIHQNAKTPQALWQVFDVLSAASGLDRPGRSSSSRFPASVPAALAVPTLVSPFPFQLRKACRFRRSLDKNCAVLAGQLLRCKPLPLPLFVPSGAEPTSIDMWKMNSTYCETCNADSGCGSGSARVGTRRNKLWNTG